MKTAIAIVLLALLQIAFFAVTYCRNPTGGFAGYYILWMLIPATVAALTFAPHYHFHAAISNGIIAALLFDYLFLHFGFFWPERPKESPFLAIGYVVFAAAIAFVMAGFVHAILKRIEQQSDTSKRARTFLAMRKGLTFSTICAAVAFPLFTMLGPAPLLLALIVAACMILTGTIIGLVVGLTYEPAAPMSQSRDSKTMHANPRSAC